MNRRRWSAREDRLLEEMTREKMTGEQMAAELGRSVDSVMKHKCALDLTKKAMRVRNCLSCGKVFPTERYIYVCSLCKRSSDWRAGI